MVVFAAKPVLQNLDFVARAARRRRRGRLKTARSANSNIPNGLPEPDEDPPFDDGVFVGWIHKNTGRLLDLRGRFRRGSKKNDGYVYVKIMGRYFRLARLIGFATVWLGQTRAETALKRV